MALVTWGGGRLRIETHRGSRGQITQEELSSGSCEVQGQSEEGKGVHVLVPAPPICHLWLGFTPGHLPAHLVTGIMPHHACVPQFPRLCSGRS